MININSITNAVQTIISSYNTAINSGINVDLYREINSTANRTPWVGVSMPNYELIPHRANIIEPWMANFNIPIFCQTSEPRDRGNGLTELSELNRIVMTAINCDRNLMDTVDIVQGFTVELEPEFGFTELVGRFFYTNMITVIGQVKT